MVWSEFLSQIEDHHSVTLVGPILGNFHSDHRPTIYVDGGVRFRDPSSKFPQVSIGDGDSAELALDERLPPQKDFTDLAYVLRHLPPKIKSIDLSGFWGGRRDHEMAVFGELHMFLKNAPGREVHFHTDTERRPVQGFSKGRWSFEVHGLFSVLVIEPTEIQLTGDCEYKVEQPVRFMPLASLGVSNSGHGKIEIESSGPAFVFLV